MRAFRRKGTYWLVEKSCSSADERAIYITGAAVFAQSQIRFLETDFVQ
jgi:hypothetical protein